MELPPTYFWKKVFKINLNTCHWDFAKLKEKMNKAFFMCTTQLLPQVIYNLFQHKNMDIKKFVPNCATCLLSLNEMNF